ncbi:alpha/beta hydrolase [Lacrimispora amygdalina]|uniref:alpha/beta hydrolase n=1 Tax=Lacrimispora amygdalina TaxID=253257 RepID=UPI00140A1261|nr:alpha/beta hydrolase [Lacrimispora amygdalina]
MIIQTHKLNENESAGFFTAYLIEDSKELLPGKKRPVMVIAPGGGYLFTSDREAEPIAFQFLSMGYHAVVLRYTTGDPEGKRTGVASTALKELAQTVRYLRENCGRLFIDPDKIGICGFSAGAHLAASLGVHWQEKELGESLFPSPCSTDKIRPNALILAYGLLDYQVMKKKSAEDAGDASKKEMFAFMDRANAALTGETELTEDVIHTFSPSRFVSSMTPPAFLWHTSKDGLVYAENSLVFALEMARHHVPYELHIFQDGEHGLALANQVTANSQNQISPEVEAWVQLAGAWLKKQLPF